MTLVSPVLNNVSSVLHPRDKKEMLSVVRLDDGGHHVRLNSSSLAVIQECLRKSKYLLLDGWKGQDESPATLFGKAVHKALEVFYTGPQSARKLPKLEILEMMSYGNAVAGEEEDLLLKATRAFIREGAPLGQLPEGDKRSLQNGVWLLHEYYRKFLDDPFIAHIDPLGPFIERKFTLPYFQSANLSIELFGTIDFCFRHSVTGELLPGDHKTTSHLAFGDSSYFDREKPNHQYTIYALAAKRLFGVPTDNFLVNVFEVKQRPKTARGSGPSFPRQITTRTEADFTELHDVVMDVVDHFLWAKARDRWPMGGVDACNKYGGCQYKQVCAAPPTMRETLLKNKFTQETQHEVK